MKLLPEELFTVVDTKTIHRPRYPVGRSYEATLYYSPAFGTYQVILWRLDGDDSHDSPDEYFVVVGKQRIAKLAKILAEWVEKLPDEPDDPHVDTAEEYPAN